MCLVAWSLIDDRLCGKIWLKERPCYACMSVSVSECVPRRCEACGACWIYHLCCQCEDAYLCVSVYIAETAVAPSVCDSSCYISAVTMFHDISMSDFVHTVPFSSVMSGLTNQAKKNGPT